MGDSPLPPRGYFNILLTLTQQRKKDKNREWNFTPQRTKSPKRQNKK